MFMMQKITSIFKLTNYSFKSAYLSSFNCWKCKKDNHTTQIQCKMCGYLLDPDYSIKKMNFYSLFGLSLKYNIDKKIIQQKVKELQKKYHPDKFTNKDKQTQIYSTQLSAYVNEAKQILMNDIKRGFYLLQIRGMTIREDQIESMLDKQFLMQIFQTLEKVQESNDKNYLMIQQKNILRIIQDFKRVIAESFEQNNLIVCKRILLKYKYYDRILKDIEARMEKDIIPQKRKENLFY